MFHKSHERMECSSRTDTLHSSDLWDLPGGATGDECYERVRAKQQQKADAERRKAEKRGQRAANKRQRTADANALGARVVAALKHNSHVGRLLVDQLRAALGYRGVEFDPKTPKAQLKLMLEQSMQLPTDGECPAFELLDALVLCRSCRRCC